MRGLAVDREAVVHIAAPKSVSGFFSSPSFYAICTL